MVKAVLRRFSAASFVLCIVTGISSVSAAVTFPLTVNANAVVTFKKSGGTDTQSETVTANTAKSVTISWLSTSANVDVSVKSSNSKYLDKDTTVKIEASSSTEPAWEASKAYTSGAKVSYNGKTYTALQWSQGANPETEAAKPYDKKWEAAAGPSFSLTINLAPKPLSTDSAYVPVRCNVGAKLTATPVKLISGTAAAKSYVFDLTAKRTDTIVLPVIGNGTAVTGGKSMHQERASLFKIGKNNLLTLSAEFKNGAVRIVSASGRQIGSMDLSSQVQNDLSIWDAAAGIYFIQISSKSGAKSAHKLHHDGGDLKLSASFSADFTVGGVLNSTQISVASDRAASTAEYKFEIVPTDSKYQDSVHTLQLKPQINTQQSYTLIDPNNPTGNLDALLDSATYEKLFPNRYGKGYGNYVSTPLPSDKSQIIKAASDGDYDFFTHNSLLKAADSLGRSEVDIYQLVGHNYMHRIVWRDKKTGATRTMINNVAYDEYKADNKEVKVATVDYANFCSEGDMAVRKQELAAFLGNISHETTGGGDDEKTKTWGLYWREEVAWQNGSSSQGYRDEGHTTYPPASGKSYHGRGPIQISWNYNYGQVSEFIYGDKNVLLNNPEKVCPPKPQDATLAFMTSIWFWMTPQSPKPSCHDVMVGNWVPTADDIAKNRDNSKFGMTVNIINGGLECGQPGNKKVGDRIDFYKRYIGLMGETPEADCDCGDMGYW